MAKKKKIALVRRYFAKSENVLYVNKWKSRIRNPLFYIT